MNTDFWLNEAEKLAEESRVKGDFAVGAILVSCSEGRKMPVGYGRNTRREDGFSFNSHAEMKAMLEGTKTLKTNHLRDGIIFTTLEPCPMCYAAATVVSLKGMVFRNADKEGGVLSTGFMDSFKTPKTWVMAERKRGMDEHTSQVFHTIASKIISSFGAVLGGGAARPEFLKTTGDLDFYIPKPFDRELAESLGLRFVRSVQHDDCIEVSRCTFDGLAVDFLYSLKQEDRKNIFESFIIQNIEGVPTPSISFAAAQRDLQLAQKRKTRASNENIQ